MKEKKDTYRLVASKMREDLYQSLKLLSAAEGKPIQELLEKAVIKYLEDRQFSKKVLLDKSRVSSLQVKYVAEPEADDGEDTKNT